MTGVTPTGPGHSAEPEPEEVSAVPVSVPNAFAELADRCEATTRPDRVLESDIAAGLGYRVKNAAHQTIFTHAGLPGSTSPLRYTASLDAALTLLEPKHDWRRLTPTSISVYAGSPYNAAAQTRYDGYGATLALQLCAAFLKMRAAIEAKAIATEARRAETLGSVHEGAGPQDIAHD